MQEYRGRVKDGRTEDMLTDIPLHAKRGQHRGPRAQRYVEQILANAVHDSGELHSCEAQLCRPCKSLHRLLPENLPKS